MISQSNLLDLIESKGRDIATHASPNYWRHGEHSRAEPYKRALVRLRQLWVRMSKAETPDQQLAVLNELCRVYDCANFGRLLRMYHETPDITVNGPCPHQWCTFEGDLFWVSRGDHNNRPRVRRVANEHMPNDRKKLDGATRLAELVPATTAGLPRVS